HSPTVRGNDMLGMRRARDAAVGVALVFGFTQAAAQSPAPLTPVQALDRHSLGDPRFSPGGDRIAYTLTSPPKGDTRNTDIWIYDLKSREARAFATSPKSDLSPRWSPDGETLAFISDRDGTRQIYLIATRGGEARALTEQKGGVTAFEWSPDGSRI